MMKNALIAAVVLGVAAPAGAQWLRQPTPGIPRTAEGKPDLTAPAPKNQDGTPDLSGIWQIGGLGYSFNILGDQNPGMRPWAAALFKERQAGYAKESPSTRCLPAGPRAGLFGQTLVKVIQTRSQLAVLYEEDPTRQIFLDGRGLPHDPNPTWMGYSVGQWEADTLVVRTAGYNDRTWLDLGGHPHSDALQVTERFHRTDFGHMDLQMTFEDPKAYERPWTIAMKVQLVPDTELLEYVCNENEKDAHHLVGDIDDERKDEVRVDSAVLAQYAGVYRAGPLGDLRISEADGQLTVELPGGGGKQPLFAQSDTRFMFPATGAMVEFFKDPRGSVSHLILRIVEGDIPAPRIVD
jgi:Domain of unknown function (DUF3471)